MRKYRTAKRIILWILIIAVALIGGVLLYVRLYGKNIVEAKLSSVLGRPIRFESLSFDLKEYRVEFNKFSVKNIFTADKVAVALDRDKFALRKVVFDRITVENGVLYIERNDRGEVNLAKNHFDPRGRNGLAYAAVIPGATPNNLYRFAENVKRLEIKNSRIEFKDFYLYGDVPYTTTFRNFNLDLTSKEAGGFISLTGNLGFSVPTIKYNTEGTLYAAISAAVYEHLANTEINIETGNTDLMQFQPYFEKYTPFYFTEGLFSSTTKFEIHNNFVRSLTTMAFHRLRLGVKPGMENSEFLETSVSRLLPYLTSGAGDIIFDFTINGPTSSPKPGLGPQVKFAIGMVVTEEVLKALQRMQR